jgi:hypothetical protein
MLMFPLVWSRKQSGCSLSTAQSGIRLGQQQGRSSSLFDDYLRYIAAHYKMHKTTHLDKLQDILCIICDTEVLLATLVRALCKVKLV